MFVFVSGGKQFSVDAGDCIKVDRLYVEPGCVIDVDEVLVCNVNGVVTVGDPIVKGATVKAEVLKHTRNDKIIVFKKRRRHNSRRKNGHRQPMTILKILETSLAKGE
ncbi:MAG: 50S ribosomal protein L21 [Holosporales bacterium]|jgi:large subunit ribosomal protein L21|nr:50S ribosomal protein L21 [Holosporales bacterium]